MPLREAVNRLFEDSFVWSGRLEVFTGHTFPVDVYETKGEEKIEKPNYVRRERFAGEMTRMVTLPTHILPEKIQATYEHGVLKLQVPTSEEVKPRQIPIHVKEPAGAH